MKIVGIISENSERKNRETNKPMKLVDDQVALSDDLSDDEISFSHRLAEIQDGNDKEPKQKSEKDNYGLSLQDQIDIEQCILIGKY